MNPLSLDRLLNPPHQYRGPSGQIWQELHRTATTISLVAQTGETVTLTLPLPEFRKLAWTEVTDCVPPPTARGGGGF